MVDFRLREFIIKCLESTIANSGKSAMKHISSQNAALQLALSRYIGFGTMKDDQQTTFILNKHSFTNEELQNQIQLIKTI